MGLLASHPSPTPVELLPAVGVARDAREKSATKRQWQCGLILLRPTQRDDRLVVSERPPIKGLANV
jgi:hypothetical protein